MSRSSLLTKATRCQKFVFRNSCYIHIHIKIYIHIYININIYINEDIVYKDIYINGWCLGLLVIIRVGCYVSSFLLIVI